MRFLSKNRRWLLGALRWLAVAAGIIGFWRSTLPPPPDPWILNLANNPDKFFLWGTTSNFNYGFTYDPHAADEWRFEHGVFPVSLLPATNGEK
jgi:hypothetical protein